MDIETMKAQVELAAIAIREKDLRADKLTETETNEQKEG